MRYPLLSAALVVSWVGCSKDVKPLESPDSGVAPAADAAVPAPDAEVAPMDAEVPDLGPPARVLVTKKLFGEMPLDNLVVDPTFDLTAGHWYAVVGPDTAEPQLGALLRREYGKTPAGLPVAEVPKGMINPPGVVAVGPVMAFAAPAVASVWIGRAEADRALTASASASLVATMPTGEARAFALAPDEERTLELDGIVWQRWSAAIEASPVGISSFYVGDDTPSGFFITAPAVVSMAAEARGASAGSRRALERRTTPSERGAARFAEKKRRERL